MYSTCTFCHATLGRNEALEAFPVGRRLAFDQARGRLWVICPACRQWNLSPLEERWEAIEAGERAYRDARQRVATGEIGLARLGDGTELIRIGEPLRPEFAAWRYGERFQRRWRRTFGWGAAGLAAFAGYALAGPALGIAAGTFSTLPANLYSLLRGIHDDRKVVLRHVDAAGPFIVARAFAGGSRIVRDPESASGWGLRVLGRSCDVAPGRLAPSSKVGMFGSPSDVPRDIRGPEALPALRQLLPIVNASGGRAATVQDAVRHIERLGAPERVFVDGLKRSSSGTGDASWQFGELPREMRLALEMAAHEETERRALEGELGALEQAWREAEEVAAIADELTLPESVIAHLRRLGRGS